MHLSVNPIRIQRGVGLIEVLIAVLVLSFGMLGLVGLQTLSLRNNQSALERGMATVQTHSIADAMRADRLAVLAGDYDIAIDDETPTGTTYRDVAIRTWRNALAQALNPTANGAIDCGAVADSICTITVQWNDSRAGGGSATQQVVTEVEL